MIRIHMTAADLARTKIDPGPSPMMETINAFQWIGDHGRRPPVRTASVEAVKLQMLADLSLRPGPIAGFLVPRCERVDVGIDRLLSTPRWLIREDLDDLVRGGRKLPDWARHLADGESGPLHSLAASIRLLHDRVVEPTWAQTSACCVDDRRLRLTTMGADGVEGLLASLGPLIRWRPPVIEVIIRQAVDLDVQLDGRGLHLVPTAFNRGWPAISLPDPAPTVIYYPVAVGQHETPSDGPSQALAALLGLTRAAAMQALATTPGLSTAQLAARISTSPATASQHATVLRNAGLISTTRRRRVVAHELTSLGRELLRGNKPGG